MNPGEPNPLDQLTLPQLRQRTSMKWRTYPDDVLPAFVAEMDVPIAESVVESVSSALEVGDTGYSWGNGYVDAFADFAAQRWGWDGIVAKRSVPVPDVMRGIAEVLNVVSEPGCAVVINCPVYPPFYHVVRHNGRRIEEAPLGADGRIDFEELEQAFGRAGAGAVYLLSSPHNPTGTVHSAVELERVAALARESGVRVISDEIHGPIVASGVQFVPYLAVPGSGSGFSVLSASKAWNLAGFKAAIVVAGPDAADDFRRLPAWMRSGASHVGEIAHTAALRGGVGWLDALLRGLDANRALLADLLGECLPDVVWNPGEATYLAWLDCRALELGEDPAAVFLREGRVALSPGPTFGSGGEGHVRLNFGTTPELLTEIVQRMAAAAA